jgi:chaperonin GroES
MRQATALAAACDSDDIIASQRKGICSMTFKPIRDNILVRPKNISNESVAETAIARVADQQSQSGTVVSTGHGLPMEDGMTRPLVVKVGDQIVFGEGAGTEVKRKGETLIVLKEGEVLGTL